MAYEKLVRKQVALRVAYEPGSPTRLRRVPPGGKEMLVLCADKVREELVEVMEVLGRNDSDTNSYSALLEEFGDLMEAVEELRRQAGVPVNAVEYAQLKKREHLGGLGEGWVLGLRDLPPMHQECWDCDHSYGLIDEDPEDVHYGHRAHCTACDWETWPCPYVGQRTGDVDG